MAESILFSIIIPFKKWSPDLDECLTHIGQLKFNSYEVLLLPDNELEVPPAYGDIRFQVIPTGAVNPAIKRDQGSEKALGEYLAFIDDDAYPNNDWLDVAHRIFSSQENVGALGGPGITPKTDPFWARVSGAVFLSSTSGGFPERYIPTPPSRLVDDWPSVNLIVRKSVFDQVDGFDSNYWPGEDTLFCLKIVRDTGFKILYVPELIVWHHRRSGLSKHLRQAGNYGLHRGFFVKKHPETSLKFKYFMPAIWVSFVVIGLILSAVSSWAGILYLMGWGAYLSILIISWKDIRRHESLSVSLGAVPYIILTHMWYGVRFVFGIASREIYSSLGR